VLQLPEACLNTFHDWLSTDDEEPNEDGVLPIRPTPFVWKDPTKIEMRRWIYRPFYIRKFLSAFIGKSGEGKTSLAVVDALSMVSGKPLVGIQPEGKLRVWFWNGEDPMDELERRFAAAIQHYGLTREDIGDRLFLDSGRVIPIVLANVTKTGPKIAVPVVNDLITSMLENKVDVLIIDPFISSHRVPENDSGGMELVTKQWSQICDVTNSSTALLHHPKKTYGGEISTDDGRGSGALVAATRVMAVLNKMNETDADKLGIREEHRKSYFRLDNGITNLSPPAEHASWYRFESVYLDNDPSGQTHGDNMGVATRWEIPETAIYYVNAEMIRKVQEAVKVDGPWRADKRSTVQRWVGEAIAHALSVDITKKVVKDWIEKVLFRLVAGGYLRQVEDRDHKREIRAYIKVGNEPADDVKIQV
jgi:RecA-family ATPase